MRMFLMAMIPVLVALLLQIRAVRQRRELATLRKSPRKPPKRVAVSNRHGVIGLYREGESRAVIITDAHLGGLQVLDGEPAPIADPKRFAGWRCDCRQGRDACTCGRRP